MMESQGTDPLSQQVHFPQDNFESVGRSVRNSSNSDFNLCESNASSTSSNGRNQSGGRGNGQYGSGRLYVKPNGNRFKQNARRNNNRYNTEENLETPSASTSSNTKHYRNDNRSNTHRSESSQQNRYYRGYSKHMHGRDNGYNNLYFEHSSQASGSSEQPNWKENGITKRNHNYGNNSYTDYKGASRNNYSNNRSHDNFYRNGMSKDDDSSSRRGDADEFSHRGDRHNNRNRKEYPRSDVNKSKSWRNNDKNKKGFISARDKKLDNASQRERLIEMLNRRLLECLVCCEKIKEADRVWSCTLCFHIMHLRCLAAWAKSSKIENGWRCPACQNVYNEVPTQYMCYCGQVSDPKNSPGLIPHSCGGMCLRKGKSCDHKCTLECHPGPCPDCTVMVERECGCRATKQTVKCNSDMSILCDSVCNKLLDCQIHRCNLNCHIGKCNMCTEKIAQECYCGNSGRKVPCNAVNVNRTNYSCGEVCGKLLSCGNHNCTELCHDGQCGTCKTDVTIIKSCPCGKSSLENERSSCLSPIPSCDEICGKILRCGPSDNHHTCQEKCHDGDCPPCLLFTIVKCRCGNMDKKISCEIFVTNITVTCEKKCVKKRLCGKHKCNQFCCIEIDHSCPLPCNRQLTCGRHKCMLTCHSGRCLPCVEASFEELYCECGASVIYPPIPCGTKPPTCDRPCSRPRPCGHAVDHKCHTGPCPPCTVLVKRWCHGRHEQRSAILCYQENFSCGLPCSKDLPCKRHKCNKPCHEEPCPLPCRQSCTVPRKLCGHPCGAACHDSPCPETNCKATVPITCLCGLLKSTRTCLEVAEEFKNLQMAQMKEKMGALSKDQSVDLSDINNLKKPAVLKILECTEECRVLERNRRLAIGLQIRNPDLGQKLMPRYTDFLKQWAKKEPTFCQRIHDKLTDLVELAKQSKQKSRSFSFESMNRDKRHVIHELAQYFGVETEAYDAEPNRNVVATAIRDKSWLPSMSLLQVIQRENGQRKVPRPVSTSAKTLTTSESVSLKLSSHMNRPGPASGTPNCNNNQDM